MNTAVDDAKIECHFSGVCPSQLLVSRLSANNEQAFLTTEHSQLSYASAYQKALCLANTFTQQGIRTGHRVVVALSDDETSVVALLALALIGAIATPFDADAAMTDHKHMLGVIRPDYVLLSPLQATHLQQCSDIHGAALMTEQVIAQALSGDASPLSSDLLPTLSMQDPMVILYTSGTTAQPKGVQLSYQAVLEQSQDMIGHLSIDNTSRIVNLFRMYQIGSMVNGVYLALLGGATLCRPFRQLQLGNALSLLHYMAENPVSHFVVVPTLLAQLMKFSDEMVQAFSHEKFLAVVSTAAHLPPVLWQSFESLTSKPIVNTYGLTEANDITATPMSLADGRVGTIGQPLNCRVKIIDAEGQTLEHGHEGKLFVTGKTQMDAYFNAPELTESVVIDGWFDTGDLAKIDDSNNIVYLGRASERIISGGHTIHPEEISHLLQGHPDISQAYVFGEPHEDWQELVAACIVPRRDGLSKADVVAFLREKLAPYKIPRRLYFVEQIPLSDRGKVRRKDVLAMVESLSV